MDNLLCRKHAKYSLAVCAACEAEKAVMGLQNDLSVWAKNNLSPKANHLGKLLEELVELEESPSDPMEIGDMLLALILHAESKGVDLFKAGKSKFEIIKTRKYGEPDENGIARHISRRDLVEMPEPRYDDVFHKGLDLD